MREIWSRKLYNPKNLKKRTQIIIVVQKNGSRVMRFRKPERSEVSGALIKWFKQEKRGNVRATGPLLIITFAFPKF